jgi:hypothetical protein
MDGLWGGGGKKYLFRMNAAHTQIQKADGSAAATALADAALVLGSLVASDENIVEQTDFSFDDVGVATFKFRHTNIEQFLAFQAVACPKKATAGSSSTKNEKVDETGRKIGGGVVASDAVPYLMIDFGPENGTNRLVNFGIFVFGKKNGGMSYKAGEILTTELEGTSVACKATLSIIAALFDSGLVTVSAAQSHVADQYLTQKLLPKQA